MKKFLREMQILALLLIRRWMPLTLFPDTEKLVFTHIAKAGGNSTGALLDKIMKKRSASILTFRGASSTFSDIDFTLQLLKENKLDVHNFQIIRGHVPFATARVCFERICLVVMLRQPIDRIISNYCSQPDNKALVDFGMADFEAKIRANPFAEWAIDNYQTRMLCDTPNFGQPATLDMLVSAKYNLCRYYSLIGFQQQADAFFHALFRRYDMDFNPNALERLNVTMAWQPFITDQHRTFAASCNVLDMQLFAWACRVFASQPPHKPIAVTSQKIPYCEITVGPGRFDVIIAPDSD
jgi:hypothetical protein